MGGLLYGDNSSYTLISGDRIGVGTGGGGGGGGGGCPLPNVGAI